MDPEHAREQFEYLIKRLDNNVSIGTVEQTVTGEYKITDQGRDEAETILAPYKTVIENRLSYLVELGLLEHDSNNREYRITNKDLLDQTLQNRHLDLKDTPLDKELYKLIDETMGHINAADIDKRHEEYVNGVIKDFDTIKTDYESMRDQYRVESTISRVLGDMSKVLVTAGLKREEALNIITEWNEKSGMKIERKVIEETLDKAINTRADVNEWHREQVMSVSRWKELFKDLGIDPSKEPKWMYEGKFSQHAQAILNQAWKAAFRAIQKECTKSEAQAELLKKQSIRQQQLENIEYRKELVKKLKTRAIFDEQEFE
jgi:DNA-directed RNA polymerase subunit H (RpoH/RPB5)